MESIRVGQSHKTAARSAGIDYSTMEKWIALGRKGEKRYRDFFYRVEEAEGEREAYLVGLIRKAAQKDWKAAAWLLRCWSPELYDRQSSVAASTSIHLDLGDSSPRDLQLSRAASAIF